MIRPTLYHPLLVVAVFISLNAFAQERRAIPQYKVYGAAENRQDSKQIEQLTNDYIHAWKELNVEQFIALHTEDTEWTNAFARIFQNAEDLQEFLETKLFPQFRQLFSDNDGLTIEPISLRYLGDDAAVLHLFAELHESPSRNIDEATRRTHFHLVLNQDQSQWKIAHTAIMDAR